MTPAEFEEQGKALSAAIREDRRVYECLACKSRGHGPAYCACRVKGLVAMRPVAEDQRSIAEVIEAIEESLRRFRAGESAVEVKP